MIIARSLRRLSLATLFALSLPSLAGAQSASLVGRVVDATTRRPVPAAIVELEGTVRTVLADSLGRYRLALPAPGPYVVRVRRIGYAPARVPVTVTAAAEQALDLLVASASLRLPNVTVTADPASRARGELATASVIGRDAIANQTAASLQGILELTPGVPLQPPGLDGLQQIALRTIPTTFGEAGRGDATDVGSFGTLVILDGVPLSNNANLQTLGARGELSVQSSSGGGIDLRTIPAAMLERVEVIRGVPSARWGDLTQGAIVVDTRAGEFAPELLGRWDPNSGELALQGGRDAGTRHTLAGNLNVARTRLRPGIRDDEAMRVTSRLAHRLRVPARGGASHILEGDDRLTSDTRVELTQLLLDAPEDTEVRPGYANRSRDAMLRLSNRMRVGRVGRAALELTSAMAYTRQRSSTQQLLNRGALPFTDRTTEGTSEGRFVGGDYLSRVAVDGDPWLLYHRAEASAPAHAFSLEHALRAGAELRREWNRGPGVQFDIETPPQVSYTGAQGFDRPFRYDAVPPLPTSAFYVDDRVTRALPGRMALDAQLGARLDMLHRGRWWLSRPRDAVLQPRMSLQVATRPWMRLRASGGSTAKSPTLGQLYPAPQWFDVANVNRYTNDPRERFALLTTFRRDPTNPDLGMARATKAEAGVEVDLGRRGASLSIVAFRDRTRGGVALDRVPGFILRDRYAVIPQPGQPPIVVQPPEGADTVPILVDRPGNVLALANRGLELSLALPAIPRINVRADVQAARVTSRLTNSALDLLGHQRPFTDFQNDTSIARMPYWNGYTVEGKRSIVTTRLVHQQPSIGLVVTGTVQAIFDDESRDIAARDTLAWAGYLTRAGQVVPVPVAERGSAEYADIRRARGGIIEAPIRRAGDWLLSVQVSKTLPSDGRLSFYAFNATDRVGKYASAGADARLQAPLRFGAEVSMPMRTWWR